MRILNTFKYHLSNKWLLATSIFILGITANAQEHPPRPIEVEVRNSRFLNFGTFTTDNSGGSIAVYPDSNSTTTGNVVQMNMGEVVTSALFDVFAIPGTIINIVPASPTFVLKGDNGGEMTLTISQNDFSTGATFITNQPPTSPNEVYVGGTLQVGSPAANPPGRYTGTIIINFIQE